MFLDSPAYLVSPILIEVCCCCCCCCWFLFCSTVAELRRLLLLLLACSEDALQMLGRDAVCVCVLPLTEECPETPPLPPRPLSLSLSFSLSLSLSLRNIFMAHNYSALAGNSSKIGYYLLNIIIVLKNIALFDVTQEKQNHTRSQNQTTEI